MAKSEYFIWRTHFINNQHQKRNEIKVRRKREKEEEKESQRDVGGRKGDNKKRSAISRYFEFCKNYTYIKIKNNF